jgi:hypothetical protein
MQDAVAEDEQVMQKFMKSPKFRMAARRGLQQHDRAVNKHAKNTPSWVDELGFHVELTKVARSLFRVMDEIRTTRVDDEAREHYLEAIDRIDVASAWLKNYLTGGSANWDEALQALIHE